MSEIGKYIYGIINSSSLSKNFDGLHTISYQDIAAVVNDAQIVDYSHMFKDALARLLVEHQKVIEKIMGLGYTVIPMRLGTFAMNEEEVKDILNKGYVLIKEIIPKISDKIEIDVAAAWSDFTLVIKEAGEEKEIKEYKGRLLSNPKGITVDDQMKIGSMVKEALDRIRESYARKIQDAFVETQCIASLRQHELMDDKMVVNIAFLIDKDKREGFDKKVEELNAKFNDKLNFRCVGPLPPYSFYTLEIKKLKFEEIDWAKKRLGILEDITTNDELKITFRKQAFSTHPDKNPDNPYAEKEFDEVSRAHKILSEYCAAVEQTNQKDNLMLVRVRPDL